MPRPSMRELNANAQQMSLILPVKIAGEMLDGMASLPPKTHHQLGTPVAYTFIIRYLPTFLLYHRYSHDSNMNGAMDTESYLENLHSE